MGDPSDNFNNPINEIDRIMHAPARLLIMTQLAVIDCADFTFIMTQTELTRGNLSTHLGKLENAGYISITKEFVEKIPRTLIRITDEGKDAVQDYIANMRQVIDGFPNMQDK